VFSQGVGKRLWFLRERFIGAPRHLVQSIEIE
jgi:hypothetical protein